jgi:dihydrofolate reductase
MEAILVMDSNYGLSEKGILPWQNKNDLIFLYKITKNNVLIMSKNTYLSLPQFIETLKNRLNIVFTKDPDLFLNEEKNIYAKYNIIFTNNYNIHNVILNNREKIRNSFPFLNKNFNIYVIGGKKIYDRYIPLCKDIWVIRTKNCFSCDKTYNFNTEKLFNEFLFEEDEHVCVSKYNPIKQLTI